MSPAVEEITDSLLLLFTQFTRGDAIPQRNVTVRQLRRLVTVLLQGTVEQGVRAVQEVRAEMGIALHEAAKVGRARCQNHTAEEHLAYCLRELQLAFEMAEQIAAEHQQNLEIAKILIHDLPIFRPFDYGDVGNLE